MGLSSFARGGDVGKRGPQEAENFAKARRGGKCSPKGLGGEASSRKVFIEPKYAS